MTRALHRFWIDFQKSTTYTFLRKYFDSKIVVIFTLIFFVIILLMIFGPLFSSNSATDSIINISQRSLISNLPPSSKPIQKLYLDRPILDILVQYFKENPKLDLKYTSTNIPDVFLVNLNSSELLKTAASITNQTFSYPILGTDSLGIDVWQQTWITARNSLLIGIAISLLEMIIGIYFGSLLGYYNKNRTLNFIWNIVQTIRALPGVIWVTLFVFILPKNWYSIYLAILIVGWTGPAYWAKVYMEKICNKQFVDAARVQGSSTTKIIFSELMPAYAGKIISLFAMRATYVIFFAAAINFLGFDNYSKEFPTIGYSFVNAIEGYKENVWQLLFPTIIMVTTAISIQFICFGIRNALDYPLV